MQDLELQLLRIIAVAFSRQLHLMAQLVQPVAQDLKQEHGLQQMPVVT
jgi:hypothetical protein